VQGLVQLFISVGYCVGPPIGGGLQEVREHCGECSTIVEY